MGIPVLTDHLCAGTWCLKHLQIQVSKVRVHGLPVVPVHSEMHSDHPLCTLAPTPCPTSHGTCPCCPWYVSPLPTVRAHSLCCHSPTDMPLACHARTLPLNPRHRLHRCRRVTAITTMSRPHLATTMTPHGPPTSHSSSPMPAPHTTRTRKAPHGRTRPHACPWQASQPRAPPPGLTHVPCMHPHMPTDPPHRTPAHPRPCHTPHALRRCPTDAPGHMRVHGTRPSHAPRPQASPTPHAHAPPPCQWHA